MIVRSELRLLRKAFLSLGAVVALIAGLMVGMGTSAAAGSLPCDIYGAAGTPCVAAHSTTRALFAAYNGPLYQVKRASDSTTTDIGVLAAGGYANAAAQDAFCAGTTCIITEIYDQSAQHNNLTIEGPGGNGGQDVGANANALPVTVGGHSVYGVYVSAGVGYRNDHTTGVATGGQPQGEYMVASGTHVNNQCCFDYGNVETSNNDTGNGHMDAINFGTECWFSPCSGSGPWVQADLENGLFAGANGSDTNNKGNSSAYVTALLKNNGQTTYAIKGGNAQSGGLTTSYNGALPNLGGYAPMHQEGAIVLGTGGDNSNGSVGSFFEGVMTSGYPTDAADDAVQANIVAAGYANGASGGGTGEVHAVGAGKCLDVPNSTTTPGTQLQIYTCNGGTNQIWTHTSSNQLTVYSGSTQMCLDAYNNQTTAGAKVVVWTCNGQTNQQWLLNSNGTITGAQSGLCLDVTGARTANGSLVELWTCNGGSNQQWTLG
ncbi:arabinofuranosidase catalytic domain-containing protein [Streptacidiphilus sp. MAP12-16]|uniref:arabinofuranosidase catalytic domain-containing protein n=1 Tax=Streptacidiphilus sp. MAP12-16 TaxID=3156300 RepID=UPI0035174819